MGVDFISYSNIEYKNIPVNEVKLILLGYTDKCDCNKINNNTNNLKNSFYLTNIFNYFYNPYNGKNEEKCKEKCKYCNANELIQLYHKDKKFIDFDLKNKKIIYKTNKTIEKSISFSYTSYSSFIEDIFMTIKDYNIYYPPSYGNDNNNNGVLTCNENKQNLLDFKGSLIDVIESDESFLNESVNIFYDNKFEIKKYIFRFIQFKNVIDNTLNNGVLIIL